MERKFWFSTVVLPILLIVIIDQLTKFWAQNFLANQVELGPIFLHLYRNPGFILGSLGDLSKLYTIVVPSTVGGLLFFVFLVLQYFLPISSRTLRAGLSVFAGGVLSNILDRSLNGSVVDFISFETPFGPSGVMNLADIIQWIGLAIFFVSYAANGKILYPPDQRRGRKWIDPRFQLKFCLNLISVGGAFAVVTGILSYTFLKFLVGGLTTVSPTDAEYFVGQYLQVYSVCTLCFFVLVFIAGIYLSHRIVGPIKGFENFLMDIASGNQRQLRLRASDEFKHLEVIADRFYQQFHERLGIDSVPLEKGGMIPDFSAKLRSSETVTTRDLVGRKLWLIFYRYATCPLCAMHLNEIKATIELAHQKNVEVLAIYESSTQQFDNDEAGVTSELLRSLKIRMIADPERKLYRAFRTRTSKSGVLRPSMWLRRRLARQRGFLQARIDGRFDQNPAHFLVNADGTIHEAFYGKHYIDHIDIANVRRFIVQST